MNGTLACNTKAFLLDADLQDHDPENAHRNQDRKRVLEKQAEGKPSMKEIS